MAQEISSRSDVDRCISRTIPVSSSSARFVSRGTRWRVDNKLRELGTYLPLYKAALAGKWKQARKFIDEHPEALTAKITIASETALHIAVGTRKHISFVELMIRRMTPEELALGDQNGETALSVAAMVGNIEAARLLVNKNPDLPHIASKSGLPIHRAARYGHKVMLEYLFEVTRDDIEAKPFTGVSGVKLLVSIIMAEFYDIALRLVRKHPELATMEVNGGRSPLSVLAEKPIAFRSGWRLKLWPQVLNPCVCWKHYRHANQTHLQTLELVKCLCIEIVKLDDAKVFSMLEEPLFNAAKLGIHEIIEVIVEVFPPAIWSSNEENHNVFQIAVLYRRENVFNLIYQMSEYKHLVTKYIDPYQNNILHLAGRLPPLDRLNLVSGAALQMQRELQWFKAVERLVRPSHKTEKNAEGKIPAVVFSEGHQMLVKEGEKWMRDTSTSCTVAAALIATVVFAAAITVPGGNDQLNGIPIFMKHEQHRQRAFIIFGVADAISLFSSVTAILMFLSILTSRYSEVDFLLALPNRLIIGLSMLFISITSMMASFSVAFYLIFGQNQKSSLIPVIALAIVPVTLFAFLQFPLLLEMVRVTYGYSMFRSKGVRMLH